MGRMHQTGQRGRMIVPSQLPIVELTGQGRLLIENHQGVLSYTTKEIRIKVSYGCVIVSGMDMQLLEMSRIKLAICGRVDGLQFLGR